MNLTTAKVIDAFDANVALIESMRALDKDSTPVSEATLTEIEAAIRDLDDVFLAARAASKGFVNGNPLGFRRRVCGWVFKNERIRQDPDYSLLYSAVNNAVKEVFRIAE